MAGVPVPEIDPRELHDLLQAQPELVLLDVRESFELSRAQLDLPGVVSAPLSALAEKGVEALPEAARLPQTPIVVYCHLGFRSAQVTWWLQQVGWQRVYNLAGGIDAYARLVNPAIGRY
jgi:rhodanese-related sulfurtransferase